MSALGSFRVGASGLVLVAQALGAQATLAGRVIDRRQGNAVATVTIMAGSRSATTDSAGRFALDVPQLDTVRLHLRRLGYGPLDTLVDLRDCDPHALLFALAPLPLRLDTVSVKAQGDVPGVILEFEERRSHGLGKYISRDELRKNDDRILADVLRGRMPGLGIQPRQGMLLLYSPSESSRRVCYTNIYLDGMPIFRSDEYYRISKEPPDFNTLFAREFDAVEFYAHPSSVPVQYRAEGARCGVLLLWSRRRK